jgi:hypothetical protein
MKKIFQIIIVVIVLGTGTTLASLAYGYIDPEQYQNYSNIHEKTLTYNALESLLNYCYEHASDSPNPVQDLLDKGFLNSGNLVHNCKDVKQTFDNVDMELAAMIKALNKLTLEDQMRNQANDMAAQYNCTITQNGLSYQC